VKRFLFVTLIWATVTSVADAQIVSLRGDWKFQVGDKMIWAGATFNDSQWESIFAPSPWEDEGFNGYDGFAWYRKEFDGKLLSKNENYFLNLGFIDDCDEVYLNGKLIGFSGYMPPKFKTAYNSERKYPIHPELINYTGKNVIAIRVYDVTLGGGIIDGKIGLYIAPKSRMLVDLQGLWDFYQVSDERQLKPDATAVKIMVPMAWDHQGFAKYDGFAWYKKKFTLAADFSDKDQDMVLLLGKIDDFDKAYLNGKLIGSTNDKRAYMSSSSYSHFRVYSIPEGYLRKGENLIEVFVEDMGATGGIYEGPVGITSKTAYERYYKQSGTFWWDKQE
jgi:beta-galactosidase/beta-glucuronidase